ncbi:MAG: phosphate acyltransferase PlsX [Phycisphaerae bacterium]|jgi:glycerol-3-phosphate acyltransferase PlsX
MRIAVDAMGGDHAPRETVRGAGRGLTFLADNDELILYGPQERVEQECRELGLSDRRLRVEPCSEVIGMDEPPIEALRHKRDSTIYRMAQAAAQGEVDAIISAGNTGAFAAACQLKIGTLPGVSRPGIAVAIPTFHGAVLVCDVGANVAPKPRHLYEYAWMSTCYARELLKVKEPRVAMMSIGEEDAKGNTLVKEARQLIKQDESLRFVGNVEGRDLLSGACDVCICDGFVGNVILKLTEGLAEGLFKTIVHEIKEACADLVPRFEPIVQRIWARHDFAEYGGAPLLGINSVAIICHGRSDERAIGNAIRVAQEEIRVRLNEIIAKGGL